MSTTPPQMARVFREFLEGEKESTRVWLRAEMDRFVDPLVDSFFARLTNKLIVKMDSDRILPGDGRDGVRVDLVKRELEDEMTLQNVMDDTTQVNEQIGDCVKQEIKEEFEDGERMLDIKKEEEESETNEVDLDDDNEGGKEDDDHQMSMNNPNGHNAADIDILFARWTRDEVELGEPERRNFELITEQNRDMSNATLSSNESSNQNLTNLVNEEECQVNNNIQHQFGETNNTGEMIVEEDEDGETQVNDTGAANQAGDDESRSMENPQMDTALPHITEHSQDNTNKSVRRPKRKQQVPQPQVRNEVTDRDNQDVEGENEDDAGEGTSRKRPRPSRPITSSTEQKQIVTINLRCPQGCPEMLTKVEFNLHMWEKHSIRQFRCVVKDCRHSADTKNDMSEHLAQSHQHITQWHCDKCDHHFTSYNLLSHHNYHYHQLGHFECSFPGCLFTGEYKKKVYDHYTYNHNQTFSCDHPGCSYRTTKASVLKAHQRVHLNMKPYRCKWLQCDYASTRRDTTIRHIRQVHFASNPSSVPNGAQPSNPGDYLEVVHELL